MLNINLPEDVPAEVREVITTLRRTHVSRFPVNVESEPGRRIVRFADSRFPTQRYRTDCCLALLGFSEYDGDGRQIYTIHSRMIQNEKFRYSNPKYHIKETTDIKKVGKLLRDYARPYTSLEVSHMDSNQELGSDEAMWRDRPHQQFNDIVRTLKTTEIAEEIMYLQSLGVQFRSDKFRLVATDGVQLYNEMKERANKRHDSLHVYLQPDGSVAVTAEDPKHMDKGAWTYASMEQAPQCVQQQVAMLRMCDERLYVPEVGRKVNENRYWIHVNPDDFKATNS